MTAPLVVPFNEDPVSTTVKTGSYTIPAGQYARVFPISRNLSIDGNSLPSMDSVSYFGNIGNLTTVLVCPPGRSVAIMVHTNAPNYTIKWKNQIIGQITPTVNTEYILSDGDSLYCNTGSVQEAYSYRYLDNKQAESIRVPSGTALIGTSYIVELYNKIT